MGAAATLPTILGMLLPMTHKKTLANLRFTRVLSFGGVDAIKIQLRE
jgi:hypothetical protein